MIHCTTPAILLHRRSYGDYDLILTLLTRDRGKCTVMAKSARKSIKRFAGILEPFADLQIVYRISRGKGLPVLEEAVLLRPFGNIRTDIVKTAYASYWSELVFLWVEEGQAFGHLYDLLTFVLAALSEDNLSDSLLSVLFQMRFIGQEGFQPVLERCACCQAEIDHMPQQQFCIDLTRGGIVCDKCPLDAKAGRLRLSKGTLKQLQWLVDGDLGKALRVRFSREALVEANRFVERYIPYHIGRVAKSLQFLQQVRLQAGRKENRPEWS
jgi:DNA repair protein RecO (recombination protein O)